MKKPVSIYKVAIVLIVFSPAALLPVSSRAALLTARAPAADEAVELLNRAAVKNLEGSGLSRERAEAVLEGLTADEIRTLAAAPDFWRAGGEQKGIRDSLMTNEAAAIVLTLLMLAVVIGAVEISRH